MPLPQIILVNGPPRSGKDTFGNALAEHLPSAKLAKFAGPLKRATHAMLREFCGDPNFPIVDTAFESYKDECHPDFYGVTPRAAYIAVSETLCKPLFGPRFFGEVAANLVGRQPLGTGPVIFTDSGFVSEVQPLIQLFGFDAIHLVQIRRSGCDFSNDSRGYLLLDGLPLTVIENDGSRADLGFKAYKFAEMLTDQK